MKILLNQALFVAYTGSELSVTAHSAPAITLFFA